MGSSASGVCAGSDPVLSRTGGATGAGTEGAPGALGACASVEWGAAGGASSGNGSEELPQAARRPAVTTNATNNATERAKPVLGAAEDPSNAGRARRERIAAMVIRAFVVDAAAVVSSRARSPRSAFRAPHPA